MLPFKPTADEPRVIDEPIDIREIPCVLGNHQDVGREETLDQLILLGENHLRHAMLNIEKHHNACRPHQGIGNVLPLDFDYPAQPALLTEVQCQEALGGLLNHYSVRRAA